MKIIVTKDGKVFKDNTLLKPRLFKDIYPSVIKDYQNGMKVKDICDKYSIGHTTLNNYLRRFNIPRYT